MTTSSPRSLAGSLILGAATVLAACGVQINYQSIGSGGGVRQFSQGTIDFGATDGPMKDDQIAAIDGNVLHIPTVIGAHQVE